MTRLAGVMALLLCAASAHGEVVERSQWLMGTELRIAIETEERSEEELNGLFVECFDFVARCERILSRWDPEAELAILNAGGGQEAIVSEELFAWLERCRRDWERTDGAFDPSVGTWILDPDSELEIGMDLVRLDAERRSVLLPEGMALDSGGDGKGIAVDHVADILREAGIESALISFGGSSSYGLGKGPDGQGWKLAVMDVDGRWIGTALLENRALSISHSVLVDQLEDGQTLERPHIYDPADGSLVLERRTSVVWSTSATAAEVLSTALIVRGLDALAFVPRFENCEVRLLPGHEPVADWWLPNP